jgi:antitoxin FitA
VDIAEKMNRRGDLTCVAHVIHAPSMSKMIQIRNVPDILHRRLRVRAARAGMSLSDYLREELERGLDRLSPEELRERLAALEPLTLHESPARALRDERSSR